jgi:hypothetical protein
MESLHMRALLPILRTDEVIGPVRTQGKVDWYNKPPRAQVIIGQHIVRKQDARAFARSIERVIGTVEAQPTADIDGVDAGRLEPQFRT